jgi:hypothetical protein
VVVLAAAGCPQKTPLEQIASRPGNAGFANRTFGPERMVTLTQGNLAEMAAATPQLRLDVLSGFLQTYPSDFGWNSLLKDSPAFIAAAPELNAVFGDAEAHDTVALHQEYKGAIVLDALVYGEFVQGPGKAGEELRRVQGRLFSPDQLPDPPEASALNVRQATATFSDYLRDGEITGGGTSVLETPVILGEKGIAGFLATHTSAFSPDEQEPYQDRLLAVVNPSTGAVTLVHDIPACRAGAPAGG